MHTEDFPALRLFAQLLTGQHNEVNSPSRVVQSMGAMQAQEYAMAKWAIGLRLPQCTAGDVEAAFQRGEILRTHMLRPTWHFVHPKDIRWLLKLTAPTVHGKNKYMYKKTELDLHVLNTACTVIESALADKPCTRAELQQHLMAAGIEAQGHRLSYIMMYAELEGLVTSGMRQGNQFTYRLMDAAAPKGPDYTREEMLALLARRYFATRAPATVRDFSYWSGLSAQDARLGARALGHGFFTRKVADADYIFSEKALDKMTPIWTEENGAFFLPDYDEYGMSYKDRSGPADLQQEMAKESVYSHWLVIRGVIAGTWRPPQKKEEPTARLFEQMDTPQNRAAVERARSRYSQFWAG